MKPTNWVTMMSGPGRGLGHAEAVQHLARPEPVVVLDRLLRDVGQHGVGAAEGDDRHLGEEEGDLAERVAGAERQQEDGDGSQPQDAPDECGPPAPAPVGTRRAGRLLAEQAIGLGQALPAAPWPPPIWNSGDPARAPSQPRSPAR